MYKYTVQILIYAVTPNNVCLLCTNDNTKTCTKCKTKVFAIKRK